MFQTTNQDTLVGLEGTKLRWGNWENHGSTMVNHFFFWISQKMIWLVVYLPLWKILVTWDDYPQYIEKVPNHQPVTIKDRPLQLHFPSACTSPSHRHRLKPQGERDRWRPNPPHRWTLWDLMQYALGKMGESKVLSDPKWGEIIGPSFNLGISGENEDHP